MFVQLREVSIDYTYLSIHISYLAWASLEEKKSGPFYHVGYSTNKTL